MSIRDKCKILINGHRHNNHQHCRYTFRQAASHSNTEHSIRPQHSLHRAINYQPARQAFFVCVRHAKVLRLHTSHNYNYCLLIGSVVLAAVFEFNTLEWCNQFFLCHKILLADWGRIVNAKENTKLNGGGKRRFISELFIVIIHSQVL